MKILALDTSCMMGSVALVEDESVVAEELLNINVTHSERLIPSVEAVLSRAGVTINDIDAFAVAIGPGSFTGLRIGLGAIKGFAFATKRPVVGISSLVALAHNLFGSETLVASVLDARRGEYYVGVNRFRGDELETILEDTVMPPEKLIDYLLSLNEKISFVGDGVISLKEKLIDSLGDRAVIPPPGMVHPRASNVAWLALKRIRLGDVDDLATLKPNYIRKSDAEMGKPQFTNPKSQINSKQQ